jgi:tetratricopeptide (TPR) repeat protein
MVCSAVAVSSFVCMSSVYAEKSSVIRALDLQLAQATSPVEKSNLNMYKARNHANMGEYDKALACYDKALKLNHKGWIHLERAKFFLAHKKYDLAESEAQTAKEETSTLESQADPIIMKAKKELEKIYLAEHPPEIIFDQRADVNRKSRFDYIKENHSTALAVSEYSKQLSSSREKAKVAARKASARKPVRRT